MKKKQKNLTERVAPFADLSTGIHLQVLECFEQLGSLANTFTQKLEQNPSYISSTEFEQDYNSMKNINHRLQPLMNFADYEIDKLISKYRT